MSIITSTVVRASIAPQVLSHSFLKTKGGVRRAMAQEVDIPWRHIKIDEDDPSCRLGQGAGGWVMKGAWRRPAS